MLWPQDLIIGGVKTKFDHIELAEALQTVFLVASPSDVYLRFRVFLFHFLLYFGKNPLQ